MKIRRIGMTRPVDDLGRIVIPKEIRRSMKLNAGDHLEISVTDNGGILLNKFLEECVFCGDTCDIEEFMGKPVCLECLKKSGLRAGK